MKSSESQIALKEILKTDKNADEVENEISLHKKLDHIHVVKFLKFEILTVDQRERYNIYLEYVPSNIFLYIYLFFIFLILQNIKVENHHNKISDV